MIRYLFLFCIYIPFYLLAMLLAPLFRAFSKDSEPASAERAMAYGKAFYG